MKVCIYSLTSYVKFQITEKIGRHLHTNSSLRTRSTTLQNCLKGQNEILVTKDKLSYTIDMKEIVFEVTQEADGGFVAECLTESIFTEADRWDELRKNVQDAVNGFFFDREKPENIRLHLVRDEVLTTA